MYIQRFYHHLEKHIQPGKVLILYGPRQVGKTTLIQDYLKRTNLRCKFDSGDLLKTQHILSSQDLEKIQEYVRGYDLIVLDEAQNIPHIGIGLKIITDLIPSIQVIATGSSSFELAGQVGEPLTGRKTTLTLFPLSQLELQALFNPYELKQKLAEFLVFGSYPAVVSAPDKKQKEREIREIIDSYLLKDILEFEKVKSSKLLIDLLRLLAFQIGSEVSLSELGQKLGIDYKTVARYLDLLEKSFVLYNVRGYSGNLRKEVTNKSKYYFYDVGIRNGLIANFNDFELRNDAGQLWENFLMLERLKKQKYSEMYVNNYFWRTWDHKEVDLIEERDGKLYGYEFKWGNKQPKPPKDWLQTYSNAEYTVINRENYLDFVADDAYFTTMAP
jgi:hypothetical protein